MKTAHHFIYFLLVFRNVPTASFEKHGNNWKKKLKKKLALQFFIIIMHLAPLK
jgi:hypothetical protein